ncbi:hypothetical protein FACS1894188_09080 [Clostridia bacterium]|nr:hypothetical protein FACS1894188_09080 [Clostridia bacterium]
MRKLYVCSEPLPVSLNEITLRSRLIGILTELDLSPIYQFEYTFGNRFPEKTMQIKEFLSPTGLYTNAPETKQFLNRILRVSNAEALDNAFKGHTRIFLPEENGGGLYLCKEMPQNIIIWQDPQQNINLDSEYLPYGIVICSNKFGNPREYIKDKFNMTIEHNIKLAKSNSEMYLLRIAEFERQSAAIGNRKPYGESLEREIKDGWTFMLANLEKRLDYDFICNPHMHRALWDERFIQDKPKQRRQIYRWDKSQTKHENAKRIREIKNTDNPTERAIALLAYSMRRRMFSGRSETTSMLAANHIMISGGAGSTLNSARYIPPTLADMVEAMSDLEKYINGDEGLDILIQAGLIHYQFETIHPFLDGNGRVGRLLITLFLMQKGNLQTPALHISYFLKKNRVEYYDRMTEVRRTGNYEQWVKFFLEAIYESALKATAAIDKLTALHDKNSDMISCFGRSTVTTMKLFAYLEENPIIEIRKTADALGIAWGTVSAAVNRLCDCGILVQNGGELRRRTFSYQEYLDILREGT